MSSQGPKSKLPLEENKVEEGSHLCKGPHGFPVTILPFDYRYGEKLSSFTIS